MSLPTRRFSHSFGTETRPATRPILRGGRRDPGDEFLQLVAADQRHALRLGELEIFLGRGWPYDHQRRLLFHRGADAQAYRAGDGAHVLDPLRRPAREGDRVAVEAFGHHLPEVRLADRPHWRLMPGVLL